jgi:TonB family protein
MSYYQDENDLRFRKILLRCIVFYFSAAAALTLLPIPHPAKPDYRDLPNRVARLMLKPVPPAPVPSKPETIKPQEQAGPSEPKLQEGSAKPASKPKTPRREIVMKSGLLGSLGRKEVGQSLNRLIQDQNLSRALAGDNLITAPSASPRKRPVIATGPSGGKGMADQKIAGAGVLNAGDRTRLEKGQEVALAPIGGGSSSGGSGLSSDGNGNGMGIRLKGTGSGNGSINYDAIARVVEQYKGGLIYLYNKELRSNPTLKGTITVEFSIDSNGKVIEARVVASTMNHAPLEKALAARIKMWKFPHLYEGLIVVTYPFVFFPV